MKLISSSDTSTNEARREVAKLKNFPSAIITSPNMIIAEYDVILDQWERVNFYNHLSNYTKILWQLAWRFILKTLIYTQSETMR